MSNNKRKYAKGDIVMIFGQISDIAQNADDGFPYDVEILDQNMDVIGEVDCYFSEENIIKKLSPSEINKINVAQQQNKIKALQAEISERQAKIKAIELAIKPVAKGIKAIELAIKPVAKGSK